jgi:hypothetical protein
MMPCDIVEVYRYMRSPSSLSISKPSKDAKAYLLTLPYKLEDGGELVPRNVGKHLSDYTTLNIRRRVLSIARTGITPISKGDTES